MQNLRSALAELATNFTESVLSAIRTASIDELLAGSGAGAIGKGRPLRSSPAPTKPSPRAKSTSAGRLRRRSAEDIEAALGQVVSLVKKNKDGLRAEQIRRQLGLQAKELPRILKEGLSSRTLKSKGQKRATTYYAA
jgi:hypothetical protein